MNCHGAIFSLTLLFALAACGIEASAATISSPGDRLVVTRKKIVLTRSRTVAKRFPERKSPVIHLPLVGGLDNPAALKKVRSTLTPKNIFGLSLEEYRDDGWLIELGYEVNYNKNFIFDITFTQSGVGAYPDTHLKHFGIDLRTGDLIKAQSVFKPAVLSGLAELVDRRLQAEISHIIETKIKGRDDVEAEQVESITGSLKELKFTVSDLDEFSISDTGVTFLFDAGFPHVVKALEPEGRYFFRYSQLKPYIRRDGLLGRFIR